MSLTPVFTAVVARLQADQGSGCLFAAGGGAGLITAVYRNVAPAAAVFPYIVIRAGVQSTANTFTSRTMDVTFDIEAYVPFSTPPSVLSAIELRVFGDAMAQTNRIPSFGLDNHPLVLASGNFSAGIMEFQQEEDISDVVKNGVAMTYTVKQTWSAS